MFYKIVCLQQIKSLSWQLQKHFHSISSLKKYFPGKNLLLKLQINISAQDSIDNLTITLVSVPFPVVGLFLAHNLMSWKKFPEIQYAYCSGEVQVLLKGVSQFVHTERWDPAWTALLNDQGWRFIPSSIYSKEMAWKVSLWKHCQILKLGTEHGLTPIHSTHCAIPQHAKHPLNQVFSSLSLKVLASVFNSTVWHDADMILFNRIEENSPSPALGLQERNSHLRCKCAFSLVHLLGLNAFHNCCYYTTDHCPAL